MTRPGPSPGPPPVPPEQSVRQRADAAPSRSEGGVLLGRFRFVYAILALVVGGAVGAFIVLAGNPVQNGGPAWSSWQPSGDPAERMQDIASHVSPQYRVGGGQRQLVAVTVAKPPTVQQVPVKYVVLSPGGNSQNIDVMPAEDTASFVLCGLGESCSIDEGAPTVERGQLLRREALELALYTFKYVHGVDSVVALLPPRAGSQTRLAVFFTKDALESVLDAPLQSTLPVRRTLTPASLDANETGVIQRYADTRTFEYSFGQAGDGSIYLALEPPPTGSDSSQSSGAPSSP